MTLSRFIHVTAREISSGLKDTLNITGWHTFSRQGFLKFKSEHIIHSAAPFPLMKKLFSCLHVIIHISGSQSWLHIRDLEWPRIGAWVPRQRWRLGHSGESASS